LEPFNALLLSWSGKGELFNLSAAEEVGTPISVPPGRILSGLYANELLLRLLQRHDPHPGLFKSYRRLLETLSEAVPEERALRVFEKHLLAEIGYGLSLETEVITGAPIFPQGNYRYVLDRGPVSAETTAVGIRISGNSLLALLYEDLTDPVILREVKRLTRAAIGKYLQGQPLRTREFCSVNCSRKRVR
jgi:DNA repair protein RecO (recombination protein O)